MFKFIKKVMAIILVLSFFGVGILLADKQKLNNEIVRLHVVANSDSEYDQNVKLQVRDAILGYIERNMQGITDPQQAKEYLGEHLSQLEETANAVLSAFGSDRAKVSLTKEEFGIRQYDTFTLPSGVYNSLRIEIGEAAGRNWWCVVFPSLCTGSCVEEFKDIAVSSGFDDNLTNTLAQQDGYKIRFFFLDCLGKIENFFHRS